MQSLQIISPLPESTIPSMSSNSMFAISVAFPCKHPEETGPSQLMSMMCNYQACSGRIARSRQECQTDQLFNSEDLVPRAIQDSMALPVQVASFFGVWSTGVLECWKNQKLELNLDSSFHYSTTPTLHHSEDFGMKERRQEPPLKLVQSRALPYLAGYMGCISYLFPQLCLRCEM